MYCHSQISQFMTSKADHNWISIFHKICFVYFVPYRFLVLSQLVINFHKLKIHEHEHPAAYIGVITFQGALIGYSPSSASPIRIAANIPGSKGARRASVRSQREHIGDHSTI